MERYRVYLLATVAIVVFWILVFKVLSPFLKQRRFRISKRETILLVALGLFMLIAFLITFILTRGTFIW